MNKFNCRGSSINISYKVGLSAGKEKYLSKVGSLSGEKEVFSNGWYINVSHMKPVQSKSNFERVKRYLTSKECVSWFTCIFIQGFSYHSEDWARGMLILGKKHFYHQNWENFDTVLKNLTANLNRLKLAVQRLAVTYLLL